MTRDQGLAILQDAIHAEHGLLLHTSNPQAAVRVLERIRVAERREEFAGIVYKQVQFEDGNLVIMRVDVGPEEPSTGTSGLPPELRRLNEL